VRRLREYKPPENEITVSPVKKYEFLHYRNTIDREIFLSNVTAKSEFTYITVINFCVSYLLAATLLMVALFLWELFFQMLIGMQTETAGEQYVNNQRKLTMSLFSFQAKGNKKTKVEEPFVSQKFFVKQMVFKNTKTGLHQFILSIFSNLNGICSRTFSQVICNNPHIQGVFLT
jgi:hypothetical protein